MIYFDNAATTPLSPVAREAMLEVMGQTFGNPSSLHGHGRAASKILRESRQAIADLLVVQPQQLLFTSGGTESINTVLKGYARAKKDQGRHIITSSLEHHAVLDSLHYLEQEGFEVTYLQPIEGEITAQQVEKALRADTILVSIMYANNETGTILPIPEIGQILKDHSAAFHVDAVQVMGKMSLHPQELGIDFLSASAHKFHGPKGIGLLYAKDFSFEKLLHGGEQESKQRAGTENLSAIAGMAAALKESSENEKTNLQQVQDLRTALLAGLEGLDFYVNESKNQLPHILNLGFPKVNKDFLLMRLDLAGISISTGSACTAGVSQPSHVLSSLYGKDSHRLEESIRISLDATNHLDQVQYFIQTIKEILGGTHGL